MKPVISALNNRPWARELLPRQRCHDVCMPAQELKGHWWTGRRNTVDRTGWTAPFKSGRRTKILYMVPACENRLSERDGVRDATGSKLDGGG